MLRGLWRTAGLRWLWAGLVVRGIPPRAPGIMTALLELIENEAAEAEGRPPRPTPWG